MQRGFVIKLNCDVMFIISEWILLVKCTHVFNFTPLNWKCISLNIQNNIKTVRVKSSNYLYLILQISFEVFSTIVNVTLITRGFMVSISEKYQNFIVISTITIKKIVGLMLRIFNIIFFSRLFKLFLTASFQQIKLFKIKITPSEIDRYNE